MTALKFLTKLREIRDSRSLSDTEKNSRIMILVVEELDEAIKNLNKGAKHE